MTRHQEAGTPGPVWRERGAPLVAGAGTGPLRGLRCAVKDVYAVRGYRLGAGNPARLAGAAPEPGHAWAVRALLDAGADIAGIAQTDEFAYSLNGTNAHYGTPPNPAAPGRIPGGSSSGPASAVALGEADIGLGSDTAGSVRVPASYCGLYGFRPTHGAVPAGGLLPLAPAFDTVGWLARDAATLARTGEVLLAAPEPAPPAPGSAQPPPGEPGTPEGEAGETGPAEGASGPRHAGAGAGAPGHAGAGRPASPGAFRTALVVDDLVALARPAVAAAFRTAAAEAAARAGLRRERVPTVGDTLAGGTGGGWAEAFTVVQAAQAWQQNGAWVRAHPGALGPGIAERFRLASAVTPRQRAEAEEELREAARTLRAALPGGTVLLLPATGSPAPPRNAERGATAENRKATFRLTCRASLAGLPCAVLPSLTVDGLPVGLAVLGPPGSDHALLALTRALAPAAAAGRP
ncbi:amidase family protein [Streptomyces sp. JJ36]|uniref:amidase family protein n=1 Tax=Streptomyces sp. JJ36 TaxID=2736645 RepID=UPI001EECF6E5|nr:amidase family protein [Streptomyces sp. JJ36]MCF6521704.1 hypothetical protein [Streptomyces sp. JJ36]